MRDIYTETQKIPLQTLLHRGLQSAFTLFYLWVGWRFILHVQWALQKSDIYVAKPPAVGGFLPIGGLVGLKRLLLTGQFETVHPAALVIFLLAIMLAFFLRRSFCGYLCPVGGAVAGLEAIGSKIGILRTTIPQWVSIVLSVPKYVLLVLFLYLIVLGMDILSIEAFNRSTYWRVADSKMLLLFINPSVLFLVTIGVIALGSMIIPAFWCRGFCPLGALLGIFSLFSPVAVRRDKEKCSGCQRCSNACVSRIPVHTKERITSTECVGCGACVASCSTKSCLSFSLGYTKKAEIFSSTLVPIVTVALVFVFWIWAIDSGHWYTPVDKEQIRQDHSMIFSVSH